MATDPTKPLLRLFPESDARRPVGKLAAIPKPESFPRDRQINEFGPKFERLERVLTRDPSGLELRADPTALAPERLLVFELRGSVGAFAAAIARVPGLELIDEEEIEESEGDAKPFVYLMVPDDRALRELLSLWKRWERGEALQRGETPWRDVFQTLRDLRAWGPRERLTPEEAEILARELEEQGDDKPLALEIELVFRKHEKTAHASEAEVATAVRQQEGRVISLSRLAAIGYHALLVELPVSAVQAIIARMPDSIAGCEPVMHIRPQSILSGVTVADIEAAPPAPESRELGTPILALLDGVPVALHPLLERHLVVDDMHGLDSKITVAERRHGTAMASLIIHGDLNRGEEPLPRRIHHIPVLAAGDEFPKDRLIIDLIYEAVLSLRREPDPSAPGVLIVNLSVGNNNRRFQGRMSAWARLLDRLAFEYGMLFIVSAGNIREPFQLPPYTTRTAFEDDDLDNRAKHTFAAVHDIARDRRLLSPAETVNGVTVGAVNHDDAPTYGGASAIVNPYRIAISNPSSALGPGFASAVKPDILMPGAREHLSFRSNTGPAIKVDIVGPKRFHGLKVASPPNAGNESSVGFSGNTSAAAALASRTCHRIHDALEEEYGETFLSLPHRDRALILKALLAHTARWPAETAAFIREVVGPANNRQHVRQKDNIRRFLGYGVVDSEAAINCAADRATFWACGVLNANRIATIAVPVPLAMHGEARPHALAATLAWFTPTAPGRQTYRTVRLRVLEPEECGALGVTGDRLHPDSNQTARGTLFHRQWSGKKAPVVTADMSIQLTVQRSPDQGPPVDEPIPYGLAVTLTMPGVVEIYDQVRQRLNVAPRAAVRPA
jgi:hypothetical protein